MGTGKAIVLVGARQVGKTTLVNKLLENVEHIFLDADDPTMRSLLTNPNTEEIKSLIGDHDLVFIDEAQRIDGIGLTLKIITDQFKKVQLQADPHLSTLETNSTNPLRAGNGSLSFSPSHGRNTNKV
jgi:hypothetical protein